MWIKSFLPFPELKTERLLLRQIREDDVNEIFFLRSDPRVLQYIDREPAKDLTEALEWIRMVQGNLENVQGVSWAICRHGDDKAIGTVALWRWTPEHYRAEIGYVLHPDHWGLGLATEAVKAVVHHAFTVYHVHSIEANTNPDNLGSAAVLTKSGFVKEAHFRENWFYNGKFYDSAVFGIVSPYPFNPENYQ